MNNNWFESRGLKVLKYQDDAITKVQESLNQREITVLAACPSAGKTLMTIYMIEEYLNENPTHKVMVLAHGTTILRTQFHDVLVENKPKFTYALIESYNDYKKSTANVNICLPQTLKKHPVNPIDLLIVDEAHHFYVSSNAKMIKNIIKQSRVKKQLLLTGTPSKFILENLRLNQDRFHIIPVTLNTIFDAGMVSEAYVEVASSTYKFNMDDYNEDDELKTSVRIKSVETNKTLDNLLEKIVHRLKSFRGNIYTNITPDWKILLKELKKTMFACRSIQQAEQVAKYLETKNINYALSTSENDIDSLQIKRFKEEESCLVLIVVYRGVLGFNYEKLVNVVDMTTSHNVDRIYQLFSRVIRVDKNTPNQKKLFFKISPNMLTDYYKHIMTAVLMLSDEDFFAKFNGKNFNDMEIPVKKIYKSNKHSLKPNPNSHHRARKYQPIDMEGLPVFEFFKNILHKKDELLSTYCMTTVRDVRAEFENNTPNGYWTKEKCLESASYFVSADEWLKEFGGAHRAACRNGWYEECTAHMNKQNHWTKEECIESAKKYNTKSEWMKNEPRLYYGAKRLNCWDECVAHMVETIKPSGYWTKERCIEIALKYNSQQEWIKNHGSSFTAASTHGWLEECRKHMDINKNAGYWTKEKCIESALKFNKRSEWSKNEPNSYGAACRNKWLDECTIHMGINKQNYWTKELCLKSALTYDTRKEWKSNDYSAYQAACVHKWLDECTQHMEILQKSLNRWTKEECIESASKYKIISDWKKYDSSQFRAANKNNWIDECTSHMRKHTQWTKELCLESALKYNNIKEWQKNDSGAECAARKNGWREDCIKHMTKLKIHWTKEICVESARKFQTLKEWRLNDKVSCDVARKKGWLSDCIVHMIPEPEKKKEINNVNNAHIHWTKELCVESAKKFNTVTDWVKNGRGAHDAAKRNGWLNECIEHMIFLRRKPYSKEECIQSASKYQTIIEWQKKEKVIYNAAHRNGWLNECTNHMTKIRNAVNDKPRGYWTKEKCIESAIKYATKKEWKTNDSGAYNAAINHRWLHECCEHMI